MAINVNRRDFQYSLEHIMLEGATGKATLTGWCDKARNVHGALRMLLDESKKELEEARGKYNQKTLAEVEGRLKAEDTVATDIARKKLSDALEEVLEEKTNAFLRSMAAPSQDAVNLLTVLNMRKSVSSSEIAAAVPALSKSLQGLALLKEIADRNNVTFPRLTTDFFSVAEETRQACQVIINGIGKDATDMSYMEMAFFGEHGSNGQLRPFIDAVDRPSFLAIDTAEIKPGKQTPDADNGGGTDAIA